MKRSRSERRTLPADYLEPLVRALGDTSVLASIRREELGPVAFQLALYFGVRRDPDTASALGSVYDRLVADVTTAERSGLASELAAAVRGGATTALALLPLLQRERDAGVARDLALAFATGLAAEPSDPIAGPRALRALLDHTEAGAVRAGIVGALLALGDARLRSLLDGTWRTLDPTDARALLALPRSLSSLLEVEWLLDWMEDADPTTFALLAGSLAAAAGAGDHVLELERELPVPAGGESLTVLRQWTVAEAGARLAPRLRDLARRADRDGALDGVFAAWGVRA